MDLASARRDTLEKVVRHPAGGKVDWRKVRSLLEAVGHVTEQHNGKLEFTIGDETEVLQPPHGKDVDAKVVVDLQGMLTRAGLA